MIRITEIKVEETYPIRKSVLREGMTLSHEMNADHDADTLHLGLFDKEQLVCVGSFMKASNSNFDGKQFQLRGMATLEEYQGVGAGKLMMQKAFEILKEFNTACLWCNARVIAVPFYKKLGLEIFADKFEIKYVGDHFVMFKYL